MATYRMANVWKDPRTGMCYFRRRNPAELRPVIGWEQKISLRTKDPKVARRRYAVVQLEADQRIREARQALAQEITEVNSEALEDAFEPSLSPAWRQWHYAAHHGGARGDPRLEPADLTEPPPDQWRRPFRSTPLARLLKIDHPDQIDGAVREVGRAAPQAEQHVTLAAIFDAWAQERQPPSKTRAIWERTIERFAEFLEHDKAEQVTRKEVVRWKDHLLASGLSPKSVSDLVMTIRTIYNHAIQNEHLERKDNPAVGVKVAKQVDRATRRLPYSDDDASVILKASRQERGGKRWIPWLLLFTGARLGEICQLTKEDVKHDPEGGWYLDIHHGQPGEGRRLKNLGSARRVPLHEQVIDEGFTEWVQGRRDGPLFDDMKPNRWGSRGDTASTTIGPWVRSLGITDPRKVLHSARHRFKDVCRSAGIPKDVHDALTGHVAGDVGSSYGLGHSLMTLRKAVDRLPAVDA